jgi:hypothetical protein
MEAPVDGGSIDGILATTIKTNDGMMVTASTTAGQLTTMTTIEAATTIIQR